MKLLQPGQAYHLQKSTLIVMHRQHPFGLVSDMVNSGSGEHPEPHFIIFLTFLVILTKSPSSYNTINRLLNEQCKICRFMADNQKLWPF